MNREDLIRMAREAGLHLPYWGDDEDPEKDPPRWTMVSPLPPLLERFAALVAAHVRETEFKPDWNKYQQGLADGAAAEREACIDIVAMHGGSVEIEAAIRARGQA